MVEQLYTILIWIHVPFGILSLVLFWIPIGVKKGSPTHRKVGWMYFISMWVVLISSLLLSICNSIMEQYMAAIYLGYLAIITAYPLWYSYEILRQNKEWSDRYFRIRKSFSILLFSCGLGMFLLGAIEFKFVGMGTMMVFFGMIGIPAGRDIFMSKAKAMDKETRMKMHIQGTIITGIAAYTAFFATAGSRIMVDIFHVHHQWMMVPWILPTFLGLTYAWYMKRRYTMA